MPVRPHAPLALFTLILGLAATAAPGQVTPIGDDMRAKGLEPEPLKVDALGLIMWPPDGALFQSDRRPDGAIVTVRDGSPVPDWSMKIEPLFAGPDGLPTPARQMDLLLQQWAEAGVELRIIENRPVKLASTVGQLAYTERQTEAGGSVILGWLFMPRDETSLLGVRLRMRPERFDELRDVFESSFGTLHLVERRELTSIRQRHLATGQSILDSMTEDRLRSLLGTANWYRYYAPAANGEERELGYYRVAFEEAPLGAIDPGRNPADYSAADQTLGLMVLVQGHYLEGDTKSVYDSDGRYWMAWDQSEEAWSIRGTRKRGNQTLSEAQTGIRAPRTATNPAGMLTVVSSSANGATRDQKNWRVPDVYMSQALRWAAGSLLPRDNVDPLTFNTYCFDQSGTDLAISQRSEQWEPAPDRTGNWVLTAQPRTDAPRIVSTYDAAGGLLRRQWPTGPIADRIDLEELHAIWVRKGLDTGGTLDKAKAAPPGSRRTTERAPDRKSDTPKRRGR